MATQVLIPSLQRTYGNRYVLRVMRVAGVGATEEGPGNDDAAETQLVEDELVPDPDGSAPDEEGGSISLVEAPGVSPGSGDVDSGNGFVDAGRSGTARYGDLLHADCLVPHAFVAGGRTGTATWAGGGGAGAHGNQPAGSIQSQVPPVYVAAPGPASGQFSARVRKGTGKITVRRSWVGINAGDQGNGWYVTRRAAARINQHERLHVASTLSIYNTHLRPLLQRIANRSLGRNAGTSAAGAIMALQGAVAWPVSITSFQTADIAANAPMGTVDTNDLASGTYPVDAGPGTVRGAPFHHRMRVPGEPNPHP
jgi:hypothetical protein